MTTLDYALAYIARGWSVIPLKPRTKEPAVKLAPFLSGEARLTPADARAWWGEPGESRSESTEYGIGIVTGKPSDLAVIDVDPRNGGHVSHVADEFPTTTLKAATGGGGLHVFCEYAEGVSCGKTSKPGVDRKGDGGYVVAPPSIHPSGEPYAWCEDWRGRGSLGSLPAWVTERRQSTMSASGDTEPWLAETLANPQSVLPGGQEEVVTKLTWWMAGRIAGNHLDYDLAFSILMSWARQLPLGNLHDPWTEAHIRDRLDRALEVREPDAGSVSGIVDDQTVQHRALTLKDKIRSAPAFIAHAQSDAASREWIATDFVAPGCWTEVIGVMKEGKTTFVCGLLSGVLSGQAYLNRECKQAPVLYVTEQVGLSFQRTLERGGLTEAANLYVLTIADLFGIPWPEAAWAIITLTADLGCRLIVIDTLARLAGMTEEDEAKSVAVLNPFLQARALGIAVLFVRHSRKAGGAINVAARGSGAITGEMDVCLYVTAPQGLTAHYRRLEAVSRLTDTFEIHLSYEDGRYVEGEDPSTASREHRWAALIQYLSSQGMAWTRHDQLVAAVVESSGKSEKTVKRVLQETVDSGKVEKSESGYRLAPTGVSEVAP